MYLNAPNFFNFKEKKMDTDWKKMVDKIRWGLKPMKIEGELIGSNSYTFKGKAGFTFDLKQSDGSVLTINGHKSINNFLLKLKKGDAVKISYKGIDKKLNKRVFEIFYKSLAEGSSRTIE
jgi:hypothetical protein